MGESTDAQGLNILVKGIKFSLISEPFRNLVLNTLGNDMADDAKPEITSVNPADDSI